MSQHISSMFEHFKLSNLKKNRLQENDKINVTMTSNHNNHNNNNNSNSNNINNNNNNNTSNNNNNHIHSNHNVNICSTTTATTNTAATITPLTANDHHITLNDNDKNNKFVVNSLDTTKMSRLKENGEFEVQPKAPAVKPKKVKNIATKSETYDTTHSQAIDVSIQKKTQFLYAPQNYYFV